MSEKDEFCQIVQAARKLQIQHFNTAVNQSISRGSIPDHDTLNKMAQDYDARAQVETSSIVANQLRDHLNRTVADRFPVQPGGVIEANEFSRQIAERTKEFLEARGLPNITDPKYTVGVKLNGKGGIEITELTNLQLPITQSYKNCLKR